MKVAIQTISILGKIHDNNVIHKDINPSNIILNPITGQLKIIDLGIATVGLQEAQNRFNLYCQFFIRAISVIVIYSSIINKILDGRYVCNPF